MKQIPNLFTLLNLVFGCVAIVFILQNGIISFEDANGNQFLDIPEKIWMASLCIVLAAAVDFLDGFVARLFKATSPMGKQLDSLADMVSFGVAPGMILYQFLRLGIAQSPDGLNASWVWLLPAFLLPVAAAWRLAKFNIDSSQEFGFKGVPTPAVGLLVASLPLIYWNVNEEWVRTILLNKWIIIATVFLLSYLMISNLPMLALKFKGLTAKSIMPFIIIAVVGLVCIFLLKWVAVPIIFITYVLVSLIFKNKPA